ncbi:hypothetical protein D3C78_470470 [compost metagenome]
MKKAALVLATSVAFFLSVASAQAATRKHVPMPSASSYAQGGGTASKSGNTLSITGGAIEGEYLPGSSLDKTVPIPIIPRIDYSIPRTFAQAKNAFGLTPAAMAATLGGAALMDGVDWVMHEGQVMKPILNDPNTSNWTASTTTYAWYLYDTPFGYYKTAVEACDIYRSTTRPGVELKKVSSTQFDCVKPGTTQGTIIRLEGTITCPTGSSYNSDFGACYGPDLGTTPTPVTEADWSQAETFVNAQTAEWISNLLRDSCTGSLAPESCFEQLKDGSALSGPSTVQGPVTTSTTTSPSGTTTKTTATNFSITYGPTYYDYRKTTTSTTTYPDGTTEQSTEQESEEPTEEEAPVELSDAYKPVVEKYDEIATGVGTPQSGIPMLPVYSPWYSFGGACVDLQLVLPVMGTYTIAYCQYIYDYVRPVLSFLLVLFTWFTCYYMVVQTLRDGRPV